VFFSECGFYGQRSLNPGTVAGEQTGMNIYRESED